MEVVFMVYGNGINNNCRVIRGRLIYSLLEGPLVVSRQSTTVFTEIAPRGMSSGPLLSLLLTWVWHPMLLSLCEGQTRPSRTSRPASTSSSLRYSNESNNDSAYPEACSWELLVRLLSLLFSRAPPRAALLAAADDPVVFESGSLPSLALLSVLAPAVR